MTARTEWVEAPLPSFDSSAAAAAHSSATWVQFCGEGAALGDLLERLCCAVEGDVPAEQRAPLLALIEQAEQRWAAMEQHAQTAVRALDVALALARQRR